MTASYPLMEAALAYVRREWAVLPLRPHDKRPLGRLVPHGLHDASNDAAVIRSWWQAEPDANIGLLTGICFDALDIDGPDGEAALDAAMPRAPSPDDDPVVVGPTVATGTGHHVYLLPGGQGSRAGLLPHVDYRGRGGYVVAPPSLHPSGRRYRWACLDDPDYGPGAPLLPAPAWLAARLAPQAPRPAQAHPAPLVRAGRRTGAYGMAALRGEARDVAYAQQGERNHRLHQAAARLGRLVGARALDEADVYRVLAAAACDCGLTTNEAQSTIASGLAWGRSNPREGIPA